MLYYVKELFSSLDVVKNADTVLYLSFDISQIFLDYFFSLTFFSFQRIIRNKKWVCYRTAIAQAGCSFLFLYSPYHANIVFHLPHA